MFVKNYSQDKQTANKYRSVFPVSLHMCVISNALEDNLGRDTLKHCCHSHVHTHTHQRRKQHDAAPLIRLVILWGPGWHTSPAFWQWFPSCVVMQLPPQCTHHPPPFLLTHTYMPELGWQVNGQTVDIALPSSTPASRIFFFWSLPVSLASSLFWIAALHYIQPLIL